MLQDFPEWEPCHRAILSKGICGFENVGGEIDKVTGKRVTFAGFPWRWTKGDGCIVRLVAMIDPSGKYRIETGRSLTEARQVTDLLKEPLRLFDVRGKVAVVTGASGAFGALAARVLAAAGARLVLAAGKAAELEATAAQCRDLGAEVVAVPRRPGDEADCEAIMQAGVERFGGLDILVVGSGLNDVSMIVDMAPERFENVMHGNVTGAWLLCRAFGKRVIPQGRGGKVVLVSSARGLLGHPAGYRPTAPRRRPPTASRARSAASGASTASRSMRSRRRCSARR